MRPVVDADVVSRRRAGQVGQVGGDGPVVGHRIGARALAAGAERRVAAHRRPAEAETGRPARLRHQIHHRHVALLVRQRFADVHVRSAMETSRLAPYCIEKWNVL